MMTMQNVYKCVAIDDEPQSIFVLQQLLEQIPEARMVATANNALSGLDIIVKNQPDIVFLDIQMPSMSGIELVKKAQNLPLKTHFVFVTAFDSYALDAIKLAAFDYLLKPVDPVQLKAVFDKLGNEKEETNTLNRQLNILLRQLNHRDKLRLNTRTGFLLIEPQEIIIVAADGNYSKISMMDGQTETVTQTIGQLAEILDKDIFFRASRSRLINLKFVRRLDRKKRKIILENMLLTYEVSLARDLVNEFEKIWK
jgi:two-component system LytT family response regulator